jgi:hypothetical protein
MGCDNKVARVEHLGAMSHMHLVRSMPLTLAFFIPFNAVSVGKRKADSGQIQMLFPSSHRVIAVSESSRMCSLNVS